jgi:hypothetical protein
VIGIGKDNEIILKRILQQNEVAKPLREANFERIRVDCDFRGIILNSVPMERLREGEGLAWKCLGRCELRVGREMKANVTLVDREVKGKRMKVIGVRECRDMKGFIVK